MFISIIESKFTEPISSPDLNPYVVAGYKSENNANDVTGNNNGTVTGAGYATGKLGNAFNFTGTGHRVDIADSNDLSFTSGGGLDVAFSISLWVYITSYQAVGNWIINKRNNTSGGDEWQMYLSNSDASLHFLKFDRATNSIYQGVKITRPSLNAWHHIAYTDDGSKTNSGMKFYLNGVLQPTTNVNSGIYTGMNNGSSIVRLGAAAWNLLANQQHLGRIDEAYILKNYQLTSSDVRYLYNYALGRTYPF